MAAALEAFDGASGLKVLQIDLLVTDLGLPGGLNGRQVADQARQRRPDLKVLFMTGLPENAVLGDGHLPPNTAIVTKAFMMGVLAYTVRDLLDR